MYWFMYIDTKFKFFCDGQHQIKSYVIHVIVNREE